MQSKFYRLHEFERKMLAMTKVRDRFLLHNLLESNNSWTFSFDQ